MSFRDLKNRKQACLSKAEQKTIGGGINGCIDPGPGCGYLCSTTQRGYRTCTLCLANCRGGRCSRLYC